MVFVKVRETYDLQTVKNKMTVIGIHTPKPEIIKANFPGLLMQCKAYRPVSCDVRVACASALPLDPLGVGTEGADVVAPEDLFNPILYKACSNFGMSQIEARIVKNCVAHSASTNDVSGPSAVVDVDDVTNLSDEFPVYYGFLSNTHEWRHANPQSGLEMNGLRPLVYEVLANVGDQRAAANNPADAQAGYPASDGSMGNILPSFIRGNSKPLPFINTTSYSDTNSGMGFTPSSGTNPYPNNRELDVPWINCVVGAIIVPPSRLHELFYRMVIEWTIEFSTIRPLTEITDWTGLSRMGALTHYQNYSYASTKEALGVDADVMDHDQTMVSANVDIKKVM